MLGDPTEAASSHLNQNHNDMQTNGMDSYRNARSAHAFSDRQQLLPNNCTAIQQPENKFAFRIYCGVGK